MKVKQQFDIKGRGTIIVVEDFPRTVCVGDKVYRGKKSWTIKGCELGGVGKDVGLLLSGPMGGLPIEGDKLHTQPDTVLDMELGRITLRQFLEVWAKDQKDRVELAGILQKVSVAINVLETKLTHIGVIVPGAEENRRTVSDRKAAFKELREAFNKIPPKWFHR